MTKTELIEALAKAEGITLKAAEIVVNSTFRIMADTLSNSDRIEIRNFGSLKVKDYDSYNGRNPKTGEKIKVKPKKLPFFKLSKDLHRRVNNEG